MKYINRYNQAGENYHTRKEAEDRLARMKAEINDLIFEMKMQGKEIPILAKSQFEILGNDVHGWYVQETFGE